MVNALYYLGIPTSSRKWLSLLSTPPPSLRANSCNPCLSHAASNALCFERNSPACAHRLPVIRGRDSSRHHPQSSALRIACDGFGKCSRSSDTLTAR